MLFRYAIQTVVVFTASLLLGCQSTIPPLAMVVAQPQQVSIEAEVALDKLNRLLVSQQLSEAQAAQVYYDRGIVYESIGLTNLARVDYRYALKLAPNYADAYNRLGVHMVLSQDYAAAFEAFDSAIELQENHPFVYLNRGLAAYYSGKAKLALDDFQQFYQAAPQDPYRMIWVYLAQAQLAPEQAVSQLRSDAAQLPAQSFGRAIIAMLLGEVAEQQFIEQLQLGVRSHAELAERLCEGYFYLAKRNQLLGATDRASDYFTLALTTNVYEYVEHKYARLELALLAQAEGAEPDSSL